MRNSPVIVVIGGGAAGFYGAIASATANPSARVIILEKTRQVLSKVKISGGGRCNVTHSCFDPAVLIQNYPRGGKELRGPFTRFQPRDTIHWFEDRGVVLKTEGDGRMFPTTDSSDTIVQCLMREVKTLGIELMLERGVTDCIKEGEGFNLTLSNGDNLFCDRLLVATGGASRAQGWLERLGHTFNPPVPSLFTFNIPNSPLNDLAGISVPVARLSIVGTELQNSGPLLITHWGFSGPAVLKLSAWGARILHDRDYKAELKINWLPEYTEESLKNTLVAYRGSFPSRLVVSDSPCALPKNLWKGLMDIAEIPHDLRWTIVSKVQMQRIVQAILSSTFQINGKSTYKEEFVTCGGVKLQEVNFKTMESRVCPGLYFAGEVLDIDGVTGGFNFQAAWTTAAIAGGAIAESAESAVGG